MTAHPMCSHADKARKQGRIAASMHLIAIEQCPRLGCSTLETLNFENSNDGLLAIHRMGCVITARHLAHVHRLLVQLTIIIAIVLLAVVH